MDNSHIIMEAIVIVFFIMLPLTVYIKWLEYKERKQKEEEEKGEDE